MTATTERRLDKIAAALTPKEAVLVWLCEAQAFGSLRAYVDSLRDAPEDAFPLVRLGREMETAVRTAMHRKPEAEVWKAVRMAVRDAGFLYYLVSNSNFRALEQRRANWLHLALVAEMRRSAIELASAHHMAQWWEQAADAAQRIYVQQGNVDALAQRYFDGTLPLFPDVAANVAAQVSELERVIGLFNEGLGALGRPRSKRDPVFPQPLDLAQLRAAAVPAIQAEMAVTVDLARAEAWTLIGERQRGFPLVERHVWRSVGP